jgi:hypothetical protein
MVTWARIADGWALNLDGTNGALVFSLPRLEIHSSAHGWRSECLMEDGTRRECGSAYLGGMAAAQATALAQALPLLGAVHAAALRAAGPRFPA